jgi:peptidyl-prolyl cis-trans isomerase D
MPILRKRFENVGGKIILFLVAVSFVIWGVNSGKSMKYGDWVIKVGSLEYSGEEWFRSYHRTMQKFHKQSKSLQIPKGGSAALTEQRAREIEQLKLVLLRQTVNSMLLLQEAKRLGFAVNDNKIKRGLRKIDVFKNQSGNFDIELFREMMRDNSMNEIFFVERLKDDLLRQQVLEILFQNKKFLAPRLEDMLVRFLYAKRAIKMYTISPKNTKLSIDNIDEKVLREFIDQNKEYFAEPEQRKVEYFTFDASDLPKNSITVSESELKEIYEQKKYFYFEKEKRDVQQIILSDEKIADELHKEFVSGSNVDFLSMAKKHSVRQEDVLINGAEQDLFNKKVGGIVFGLKEGEFSAPIKSKAGWHIFKVDTIYSERTKSFSEVKDFLISQLRDEKLFEVLNGMAKDIEQVLSAAGGYENFVEIAQKYKLKINKLSGVTKEKIVDSSSAELAENIRNVAFEVEPNETSNIIPIGSGEKFLVLHVVDVKSGYLPEFEQIKGQARDKWKDVQLNAKLFETAVNVRAKLGDVINKGEVLYHKYDAKKEEKGSKMKQRSSALVNNVVKAEEEIEKIYNIRSKLIVLQPGQNPPSFVPVNMYNEVLFDMKPGEVSTVHSCAKEYCYVVSWFDNVSYYNDKELSEMRHSLAPAVNEWYQKMLFNEYLRMLRKRYKVEIRYNMLDIDVEKEF